MTVDEKPDAALCVHEWARECHAVAVARFPTTDEWERTEIGSATHKVSLPTTHGVAFPCIKCGSLLVLQEREG